MAATEPFSSKGSPSLQAEGLMKQSSLSAKLVRIRWRLSKARSAQPQTRRAASAKRRWLHWTFALLLVAAAAAGTFAVLHFAVLSRVPHAMLGKWHVVGGEMDGAILEFRRDGTLIGTVNMKGKEGKIKGTVELDGQALRITSVNPHTKQPETDTQTIHVLTTEQFVIEDRKGTKLTMQRLHEPE